MKCQGRSPSGVYGHAQPPTICARPGRAEYNDPFKLRFEMPNAPYYAQPVNLRSRVDEDYFLDSGNGAGTADHAGLIVDREALDKAVGQR
jgi:hypothetical protein